MVLLAPVRLYHAIQPDVRFPASINAHFNGAEPYTDQFPGDAVCQSSLVCSPLPTGNDGNNRT